MKYPASMRIIHWVRAALILGLIWSGWTMTRLPNDTSLSIFGIFYDNHKQFGVLSWLLAIVHIFIRWKNRSVLPQSPESLMIWEKFLSHLVHRLILVLTFAIPLLGYSMSASFTESDGVPFFILGHVPEILPKNDEAFQVFRVLHRYSAYVLLGLIMLHIAGSVKHRFTNGRKADVLPRML